MKMASGICVLSVVPVRFEPSDKSEMTSQLLFGEMFEITETSGSWVRIRCFNDGYEGWLDVKQFKRLSEPEVEMLQTMKTFIASDIIQLIYNVTTKTHFPLIMGSSLPGLAGTNLSIAGEDYEFESECIDPMIGSDGNRIVATAKQYINAPYLWGGRTPFGIDCSGFTQLVMKINGVSIFRDAAQQAQQGHPIDFISEAKAGDLAFFENADGNIVHTGILLNDYMIIHASGFVRIDSIDHEGIYNNVSQRYTHKLKLIKRFI